MKKVIIIVVVLIVCVFALFFGIVLFGIMSNISLYDRHTPSVTNIRTSGIEQIFKIRSLQINENVRIDTTRVGTIMDDRLIRTYEGTINLGIDFADTLSNWAVISGNNAYLRCPAIKVLNADRWVITNCNTFIEDGEWGYDDLAIIDQKANEKLLQKSRKYYLDAEINMRAQLTDILSSLGYSNIEISFEE